MPKKDTKLEKLSEKIHITVEEIRNLGVENMDCMFILNYSPIHDESGSKSNNYCI